MKSFRRGKRLNKKTRKTRTKTRNTSRKYFYKIKGGWGVDLTTYFKGKSNTNKIVGGWGFAPNKL